MAIIKVDYGTIGGGTDFEYVATANKPAGTYTYHTDNAFVMISDMQHCMANVKDGVFTSIVDAYHSQFNAQYDPSTKILTVSIIGSSRNLIVAYNNLG